MEGVHGIGRGHDKTYLLDIFEVESYNATLNFHGFMSIEIL